MTLLLIYLLISGGGKWSIDSKINWVFNTCPGTTFFFPNVNRHKNYQGQFPHQTYPPTQILDYFWSMP
jgi:hypothetical protein